MERTTNRIELVGRIGRDPDTRHDPAQRKTVYLSLATTRGNRTDWHRLAFRGNLATWAENNLHRGDRLYATGVVAYDSYEREGVTIPVADILVQEAILLSRDAPDSSVAAEPTFLVRLLHTIDELYLQSQANGHLDTGDLLDTLGSIRTEVQDLLEVTGGPGARYTVRPLGGTSWAHAVTLPEAHLRAMEAEAQGLRNVIIYDELHCTTVPRNLRDD